MERNRMTVEIYSKPGCPYCVWAKELLAENGMAYTEKVLGVDFAREFILEHFPGQRTYPVIIVQGMNVGGYEGLKNYLALTEGPDDTRKFLRD